MILIKYNFEFFEIFFLKKCIENDGDLKFTPENKVLAQHFVAIWKVQRL
jgi:hypothetical protein